MGFLKRLFSKQNTRPDTTSGAELSDVLGKLETVKRRAYVPITESGDSHLSGSKISGHPQVNEQYPWPVCPNCGGRMQLFWQQDLADDKLSHSYPVTSGLLQIFYCVSSDPLCEDDCESYAPFSTATKFRVVPVSNGQTEELSEGYFPARRIVGWNAVDDYPNWEELNAAGISLSDAESEMLFDKYPLAGEKVGGWPYWVQSVEYPNCTKCSTKMEFLLQIDSEGNLPYMFGDVGCGHLTFCREHPEVMSFHWACH